MCHWQAGALSWGCNEHLVLGHGSHGRTVVGGGLTIAAAGFAGHYVLQVRKYTEPKMESFLKPTKICLQWWALQRKVWTRNDKTGGSIKTRWGKSRDVHWWTGLLKHPGKGVMTSLYSSPNQWCEDLLQGQAKSEVSRWILSAFVYV